MTQDIAQCRFRHLIQSDVKIGNNFLHPFIDLPFAVSPEEIAAEITRLKCGVRGDFPGQAPLVQCDPDNDADLMTVTGRK